MNNRGELTNVQFVDAKRDAPNDASLVLLNENELQ